MGKSNSRVGTVNADRVNGQNTNKMASPDPQLQYFVQIGGSCSTMEELVKLVTSFSELENTFLSRTYERAKIKNNLLVFNSLYRDIPEPKQNHLYFSKISDLLARYIGLEILSSEDEIKLERREGKDLISRIVTTLFTLLDKSEEHVLDTLLRLKAPFEERTTSKDVALYTLLFRMVVERALKRQIDDLIYIRYVLVCRLWKTLVRENKPEKERVIKFASKRLRPPPGFSDRRAVLPKILPKPPKGTKNITKFFLTEHCNVRRIIQRWLEFSSQAVNAPTMFPNLSCPPRIISSNSRNVGPVSTTIQDFSTRQSLTEEVSWRLRCEDPPSEASLYEQVTRYKRIPRCTDLKLLNLLNNHHIRDKPQKVKVKKRSAGDACAPYSRPTKRICNGEASSRVPASLYSDASECESVSVQQTPPKLVNPTAIKSDHNPRKSAFVMPFNGNPAGTVCSNPASQVLSMKQDGDDVKSNVVRCASKPKSRLSNPSRPEMPYGLLGKEKNRWAEVKTGSKSDSPCESSPLNESKPLFGFDTESLGLGLGGQPDVPADSIRAIMEALDQIPADPLPETSAPTNGASSLPFTAAPLGRLSPSAPMDCAGLLSYEENEGIGVLKSEADAAFWQADFAAYNMPGTASSEKDLAAQWSQSLQPEFSLNPLDPELDLSVEQLSAGLIDQTAVAWDDTLHQAEDEWFKEVFQSSAPEISNLLLSEESNFPK